MKLFYNLQKASISFLDEIELKPGAFPSNENVGGNALGKSVNSAKLLKIIDVYTTLAVSTICVDLGSDTLRVKTLPF